MSWHDLIAFVLSLSRHGHRFVAFAYTIFPCLVFVAWVKWTVFVLPRPTIDAPGTRRVPRFRARGRASALLWCSVILTSCLLAILCGLTHYYICLQAWNEGRLTTWPRGLTSSTFLPTVLAIPGLYVIPTIWKHR